MDTKIQRERTNERKELNRKCRVRVDCSNPDKIDTAKQTTHWNGMNDI